MRYCIFSGSSAGVRAEYSTAAEELGRRIAEAGIGLVYGGSSVGLMGVVANAALAAGGKVIGVIPQTLLERDLAHRGLRDLRITTSMHERKALMAELSDGFIALPGGIGTLEETFEIWTWAQLGHHAKPCALLNCEGYYNGLNSFLDTAVREGFLRAEHRRTLICEDDPAVLMAAMDKYVPVSPASKWMGRK